MKYRKQFMRVLFFVSLIACLLTGLAGTARLPARAAPQMQTATNVVISEFRFRGSGGESDEFIEIYNPTSGTIDLNGWKIRSSNSSSVVTDLHVFSSATGLGPGNHFLIASPGYDDPISPDAVYSSGNIGIDDDGGIALTLSDGTTIIDQVGMTNCVGCYFEGTPLSSLGTASADRSYERRLGGASDSCVDSDDNSADFQLLDPSDPQNLLTPPSICGTILTATPSNTPTITKKPTITRTPTRTRTPTLVPTITRTPTPLPPPPLIAINEFVPRPGHDWNNDGIVNVGDEYIELLNHGVVDVNLSGWSLDDEVNIGSSPYRLPGITLSPGERIVFYGKDTNLLLSDGGDGVRLLKPNGQLADAFNYRVVRYPDQAYCRYPDNGGADDWNQNCFPTPGLQNSLSGSFANPPNRVEVAPLCPIADTLPLDFVLAECPPFGGKIFRPAYWDKTGWYGERYLPESSGKWPVFVD